jgi:hypothetical protein
MTYKDILLQELETAPDELLVEAIDFIRFLKTKPTLEASDPQQSDPEETANPALVNNPQLAFSEFLTDLKRLPLRRVEPIRQEATGKDLLKFIGTWQGDDLEECRQFVEETRSQAKF